MRRWYPFLVVAALIGGAVLAQSSPPPNGFPRPRFPEDDSNLATRVQRTMTLLAKSTATHHNHVRVLFYGQSITQQEWWKEVAEDLRRRFPNADLEIRNLAIGGFNSAVLSRVIEHDLFPFYPDLVIFHDYGPEPEYEAMVAAVRSRTTAEMMLLSDHVATGQSTPQQVEWHDRHSNRWLPEIAAKYGCEYVDIREPWKQYLKDQSLKPEQLLKDAVHLNDQGCFLMADLVKRHLRYLPKFPADGWKHTVRAYPVGTALKWQGDRLTLPFEGNRVDLIAAPGAGSAQVRIDGRKPSAYTELYAITRPSACVGVDWPAVLRISHEKPLLIENWTLRIRDVSEDAAHFRFEVTGSRTGPDGGGSSDAKFVSNSGRVAIDPADWWLTNGKKLTGKAVPNGFEVKWQVVPQFLDTYAAPKADDPTREVATTVVQGLPNGKHVLELTGRAPLRAVRVYYPPLD